MAQYRSGHNGAVLKTVVVFIRPVGSNPTCAAKEQKQSKGGGNCGS